MRTESILTRKTASGHKQETVVLPTWRKNKLLMIRNSKKQQTRHIFSCSASYNLPSDNTYAKMIQG